MSPQTQSDVLFPKEDMARKYERYVMRREQLDLLIYNMDQSLADFSYP
jgi:hypothetical protein